MIPNGSWLAYMQKQLQDERGFAQKGLANGRHLTALQSIFTHQGEEVPAGIMAAHGAWWILADLDIGNSAIKVTFRHKDTARMVILRIPTSYGRSQTIRAGESVVTYRLGSTGKTFRLYDTIDGQPIQSGFCHERLRDSRMVALFWSSLIEGMIAAGYRPGEYTLALGLGLPNEEVVRGKAIPQTQEALDELRGTDDEPKPQEVVRVDERGQAATWTIRIVRLFPGAQTLGTFAAWHYGLNGEAVNMRWRRLDIFDIGGEHQSHFRATLTPRPNGQPGSRLSGEGRIIGKGVVGIVDRLIDSVKVQYQKTITRTAAHQAVIDGTLLIDGQDADVRELIDNEVEETGEDLVAPTAEAMASHESFVMDTGGGVVGLREMLEGAARAANRKDDDHLIMPDELTGIANSLGLWALTFFAAQQAAQASLAAERESLRLSAAVAVAGRNGNGR